MKKQLTVTTLVVALIVAIGLLWLRIRSLENTVAGLEKQFSAKFGVVSVQLKQPDQKDQVDKQQVFKLIDSAKQETGTSNVRVPWSVERAMIPSGNSPQIPRTTSGDSHWEATPLPETNLQDIRLAPKQSDSK
jgi:hypothetical protein